MIPLDGLLSMRAIQGISGINLSLSKEVAMVKFLVLLVLTLGLVLDVLGIGVAVHSGSQTLLGRYVVQALLSCCLFILVAESK